MKVSYFFPATGGLNNVIIIPTGEEQLLKQAHTCQVLISRNNLINLLFRKGEDHPTLYICFRFLGGAVDEVGLQRGKQSSPLVIDSTNSLSVLGGRWEWCVGYSAT